jgi:COP9 signalosome complex subunit 1
MASTNDNSPKLDLDSYISNYKGRLRIDRLLAIGRSDSHLAPDALRLAITEVRNSSNAEEYAKLASQLQEIAPNDPMATIDTNWVTTTTRRSMMETERLEAELKQYKNNLIKESIRVRCAGFSILQTSTHQVTDGQ